jgi:hypothetical protein
MTRRINARDALVLVALLCCGATFRPGRITHLNYDAGPYRGFVLEQQGVTVEGDGVIGEDVGIAYPQDASGTTADSTAVYLRAPHITLRDLVVSFPTLNGPWGQRAGAGDGIRFEGDGITDRTIWSTVIDHVSVLYPGRNCLRVDPGLIKGGGHAYWVSPTVRDFVAYGSLTDGVWVQYMTDADWTRCTSTKHAGWGFVFKDIQTSRFKIAAENTHGGILVERGEGCTFDALHVEEFAGDSMRAGLVLDNCHGVTVGGSSFANWGKAGATSIVLRNGTTDCVILPNFHANTAVAVRVDASSHGNTIYAQSQYNYGAPPVRGKLIVDRRKNRVIE